MKLKQMVLLLALSFLFASYILELITFGSAYQNSNKKVIVSINKYGEANFELILLFISVPVAVFSFYPLIKLIKQEYPLRNG